MTDILNGAANGANQNPGAGGGNNPGVVTPPAAGGAPNAAPSWRDTLPDDIKGDPHLARYSNVADAMKSLVHAQKQIGADKIIVPTQHSTDEDWNGIYRKLGLPETLDKYEAKPGEGVDAATFDAMKAAAHKAGILPKQFQKIADEFMGVSKAQAEAAATQANTKKVEAVAGLKKEWGAEFDNRVKLANAALDAYAGDKTEAQHMRDMFGSDPVAIKMLAKLGMTTLKEDQLPAGFGKTSMGMTPAQTQAKIDQIRGDKSHPYNLDKNHPAHKAAVAEMEGLYQSLHPGA